jgi:hypothetical protein
MKRRRELISVGEDGSVSQGMKRRREFISVWEDVGHISGVKRRRELLLVWEDVGAYLRGEEKEGASLSVGGRGSISQGWRRVRGVYYRGGEEGEYISGMKKRRDKKREELI